MIEIKFPEKVENMSRIYNACVIYGVKVKIKVSGSSEVHKIALGEHDLSRKAVKIGLHAECRSMAGYLRYEEGDAYLIVGERLARADVDGPFDEFEKDTVERAIKETPEKLKSCGFSGVPQFHLVCDHSD
ncbi:MAG: hypothetical protein U1E10_00765 [Bdellovibrionales bacterium]|nr:hypothetical protein [Bdellovibrionales bacterium]